MSALSFQRSTTRTISIAHADHILAALEASCGALTTLESLRARTTGPAPDLHDVHRGLTESIESLRHAILQLRIAADGNASMLAFGFVLGAEL